ncbi:dephospho-CoA kinase [Polaribacter dokdonensis]|uniref:Dephospho-CoA kinase n=1 Tax=Polaribacter dokdonensis DSW-5 TaxID=1300348 RepID=A0A0M9CH29_9FLAO|nr:dephospho-CoA kinase [Polaribacter dokdonensis]KOY52333.1 Dephospho-CoA kinase [Polaribacter dokdonensis DSW-5]SEE43515.1 dephospho-CoA kinase [Polaribacter dokdonensis DSW-5]
MKIVGLTGGIGSGKTTVANLFATYNNVAIYIADVEAKKLMHTSSVIKSKVIQEFGEKAYSNNQLNRAYISNIVFKDKSKLEILNKIVHPEVRKHFQNFVKSQINKDFIIYEAAILFESKSNLLCDFIITVYVDLETKLERIISRDNSSRTEVLNRIKNQLSDTPKLLQSNYIIYNKNLDQTKLQVEKIHKILTEKA